MPITKIDYTGISSLFDDQSPGHEIARSWFLGG